MLSRHVQHYASEAWKCLKSICRPNFYRLHLCYFIAAILVSSAVLWGSSTADFQVRYIDALFLCCSAMCNVGLTTINLGSLNGFQQSVLFVMMLMGDLSLVTISVVLIRRYYFAKYMNDFLQHSRASRRIAGDIEHSESSSESSGRHILSQSSRRRHNASGQTESHTDNRKPPHMSGYGGFPTPWDAHPYRTFFGFWLRKFGGGQASEHSYLSFKPRLDDKGRFHSLTREQEQELGGVEFRALRLLTWLLPAYAVFWLAFIVIVMTPYVSHTNAGNVIRTSQPGNLNPAWWSIFASVSAYSNCGLSLLNDNMIPLNNNYLILIFTGMVTLAGNTLYPVFLHLAIWLLSKLVPKDSEMHHTLVFLRHHPRRCYLFLLHAKNTLILLPVQAAINLVAWVLRGRHRILPMAVDHAILLPGQDIMEESDKRFRAHKETERGWERDRDEIREDERGSDIEQEQGRSENDEERDKDAKSKRNDSTDQDDEE